MRNTLGVRVKALEDTMQANLPANLPAMLAEQELELRNLRSDLEALKKRIH